MCLGIPAQVLRTEADHPDLMIVSIQGAERAVNVALLDVRPSVDDWVMLHMGFALEPMTAQEAADAMAVMSVDEQRLEEMLAERPRGSELGPLLPPRS